MSHLSHFRPILYRSLEVSYSSNTRVMTYILPSFLISVLLNIPKVKKVEEIFIMNMISFSYQIDVIEIKFY